MNRTPNFSKERITRLEAGMGIYVPPGHWHRVVPVTEDPVCLSIDIRIASVTMARWLCENVFAKFMCEPSFGYIKDTGQNETLEQDVAIGWGKYLHLHPGNPLDNLHTCLSRHVEYLKAVLSGAHWRYRFCDPPVAMPFEPDLSDGMDLCASLEFLIDKQLTEGRKLTGLADLAKKMKEGYVRKWKVALTPFVAVTKKEAEDGVVMHMRHTSGLTNMDYQRYGILCPFDCETLIDRIIDRTPRDLPAVRDGPLGRRPGDTRRVRGWPRRGGRLADAADVDQLRQPGAGVPRRAPGGDACVFGGFDEEEARMKLQS